VFFFLILNHSNNLYARHYLEREVQIWFVNRLWHRTEQVINHHGMNRVHINHHNGNQQFQHRHVHFVKRQFFQLKKLRVLDKNFINFVSNVVKFFSVQTRFSFSMMKHFWLILVSCNTLLNSGNLNEHDKKIYCTACYRRQFGPHGSKLSMFFLSFYVLIKNKKTYSSRSRIGHNVLAELRNTTK